MSKSQHRIERRSSTLQGTSRAQSLGRLSFVRLWALDAAERVVLIRGGVPAALVKRVGSTMRLSVAQIARLVGVPPRSFQRKVAAGARLNMSEGERVLGLARLVGQVEAMVVKSGRRGGSRAGHWLEQRLDFPQETLDGLRPRDLLDTDGGRQLLFAAISRVREAKRNPNNRGKLGNKTSLDVMKPRRLSGERLWRMKREQQARDRELVARGAVRPEAMLFLRPDRLRGARITWHSGLLTCEERPPARRSRQSGQVTRASRNSKSIR